MKTMLKVSVLALAALALAGCQPAANTNSNTNGNTNANVATKPAEPTADSLMAMETKAWEAYKNKDGKYFEGYLAERVISGDGEGSMSRTDVVKMITDHKDEVKSFSISDPHVTAAGADVVVLTYKATVDGTENGKPIPSPAISSSVFVRNASDWKVAYHNEVPIMEAPKPAADANKPANTNTEKKMPPPPPPAKDEKMNSNSMAKTATANSNSNSNTNSSATSSTDAALTDALMALEKKGWEGWKAKDPKALDEVSSKDIAFIDAGGKATYGKDSVMKMWTTDNACNVSSVSVSDGKAEMLSKDAAILVAKGTAVGTCGDMKLAPLWTTTVFVKEGEAWKAAYIFETPIHKK